MESPGKHSKIKQDEDHPRPHFSFTYATRENTLYHLTPFNQRRLDIPYVNITASSLFSIQDVLEKIPKELGLRKFLGFTQPMYLSTLSPLSKLTRGTNEELSVSMKARNSFMTFHLSTFLSYVEMLKPEIAVGMAEEKHLDPKMVPGKKSDKRAVRKMLKFLDGLIELVKEGKSPNTKILAPVVDVDYDDIRQEMVKSLEDRVGQIQGLMIYGLNGIEDSEVTLEHKLAIVRDIEPLLQNNFMKNKIIGSCSNGDLTDVMFKLNLGFNFFESSLPFELAEKGFALNFIPEDWLAAYHDYDGHHALMENGRLKPELDIFKRSAPLLNLKDQLFMQQKEAIFPLLDNYPFKEYTKSYICHLLNNGEMTGNVLLTLHNCFVYQEVFKVLNKREFWKNRHGLIYAFCKFVCT